MSKGIRIADDDPVFILVALNEAVLEDLTKKHQQALNSINVKFSPTTQVPSFHGSHALATATAVTALGVGVAIGSNDKYMLLIGMVGIFLGAMLGSICTAYFQITVSRELTMPEIIDEQPPGRDWTEDEFQRVATKTTLPNRTLMACKDILVGGISSTVAAKQHSVLPPEISRGLKSLRNKKRETQLI